MSAARADESRASHRAPAPATRPRRPRIVPAAAQQHHVGLLQSQRRRRCQQQIEHIDRGHIAIQQPGKTTHLLRPHRDRPHSASAAKDSEGRSMISFSCDAMRSVYWYSLNRRRQVSINSSISSNEIASGGITYSTSPSGRIHTPRASASRHTRQPAAPRQGRGRRSLYRASAPARRSVRAAACDSRADARPADTDARPAARSSPAVWPASAPRQTHRASPAPPPPPAGCRCTCARDAASALHPTRPETRGRSRRCVIVAAIGK